MNQTPAPVPVPTTTHEESGTAHTEAEPATQLDGIPAEAPAVVEPEAATEAAEVPASPPQNEVAAEKKEEKKAAVRVGFVLAKT